MARAANTEIAPETKNSPTRTLTSIVMRGGPTGETSSPLPSRMTDISLINANEGA